MSNDPRIIKNQVGLLKLSEMLGSVLDRARAFARSRPSSAIRVFLSRIGNHLLTAGNSSSYTGAFF